MFNAEFMFIIEIIERKSIFRNFDFKTVKHVKQWCFLMKKYKWFSYE